MNLQERMLQNEIKHLGQIIQTLAYEMIVLQDFLKDEHGSKFENFRTNYSGSSSANVTDARKSQKQSTISTKIEKESATTNPKQNAEKMDDDEHANAEHDGCRSETGLNDSDGDATFNEGLSDSDTSVTLKDPLDTNEERKGGRKKTKIWKYFDKITHRNNKFSARCHLCKSLVSSRASRMVEHRLKCKRNARIRPDQKLDAKRNYSDEIRQEMKLGDFDTGEFSDEDSFLCSDDNEEKTNKKSGGVLDAIWSYYEIVFENDLRKAKCLSCGQFVSPKAVRMRQHKISCTGEMKLPTFETEEFSDGESFLCNDNDQNGSDDKATKKSGRMLDTIWSYYEIVYQNDLKKAKCVSCGQFVSPKAVRMRQHKIGCKGAAISESERQLSEDG